MIATFICELQSLAKFSNYDANFLDNMSRDCLACGITDSVIQCWLLAEYKFSFSKWMEAAARNPQTHKGQIVNTEVDEFSLL